MRNSRENPHSIQLKSTSFQRGGSQYGPKKVTFNHQTSHTATQSKGEPAGRDRNNNIEMLTSSNGEMRQISSKNAKVVKRISRPGAGAQIKGNLNRNGARRENLSPQNQNQIQQYNIEEGLPTVGSQNKEIYANYSQLIELDGETEFGIYDESYSQFRKRCRRRQMNKRKEVLIEQEWFQGRNDMQVDSTKIEESISMVPILKIPTSTSMSDTEHQYFTQKSMKSQKKVSIHEVINQPTVSNLVDKTHFDLDQSSKVRRKEDSNDQNSIISEEDSAFEETPYHKSRAKKPKQSYRNGVGSSVEKVERQLSQMSKSNNQSHQRKSSTYGPASQLDKKQSGGSSVSDVNGAYLQDPYKAKVKRQQTLDREIQRRRKRNSPSFKGKGDMGPLLDDSLSNSHRKTGYTCKKGDEIHIINIKKQTTQRESDFENHSRKSRNDSLNLTSDNQLDQLSVNVGRNTKNKFKFSNSRGRSNERDTDGIVQGTFSVISGTSKSNPFTDKKKSSQIILAKSSNKADQGSNGKQSNGDLRKYKSNNKLRESEASNFSNPEYKKQKSNRLSRQQNVQFQLDFDNLDLKDSIQKANKKMIQVYLKTPYKVLTIVEIKKAQREKNELKEYSPMRLFKAENNLDLHTDFRRKTDQEQNSIDISQYDALAENLYTSQKQPYRPTQSRRGANGPKQAQISSKDLSVQKSSIPDQAFDLITTNSRHQRNSFKNLDNSNGLVKDRKQQEKELEQEFKMRFYNDLHEQFDRRIEMINNQNNVLRKQKQLFNIYGQSYLATNHEINPSSAYISEQDYREMKAHAEQLQPLAEQLRAVNRLKKDQGARNSIFKLPKHVINLDSQDMKEAASRVATEEDQSIVTLAQSNLNNLNINSQEGLDQSIQNVYEVQSNQEDSQETLDIGLVPDKLRSYLGQTDLRSTESSPRAVMKKLLQMSQGMGYSISQMRQLSRKQHLLEQAENLHEKNRREKDVLAAGVSGSAQVQSGTQNEGKVFLQQSPELHQNLSLSRQKKRRYYSITGKKPEESTGVIKTYYREPEEPLLMNDLNEEENSLRGSKNSKQLQLNKMVYIEKINKHLNARNLQEESSRSSPNVTPMRRENYRGFTKNANPPSVSIPKAENVRSINNMEQMKDYFGNKINLKRSFDNKHYETKGSIRQSQNSQPLASPTKFGRHRNGSRNSQLAASTRQEQLLPNRSLDKPTMNYIKENRKNLLPFTNSKDFIQFPEIQNQVTSKRRNGDRAYLTPHPFNSSSNKPSAQTAYRSQNSNKNADFIIMKSCVPTTQGSSVTPSNTNGNTFFKQTLPFEAVPIKSKFSQKLISQHEDHMASPIREAKAKVQQQSRQQLMHQARTGRSVVVAPNSSMMRNSSGQELRHQYKNVAQTPVDQQNTFGKLPQLEEKPYLQFPSSSYGVTNKFCKSKQSQILQGVLKQQRRLNRITQAAHLQSQAAHFNKGPGQYSQISDSLVDRKFTSAKSTVIPEIVTSSEQFRQGPEEENENPDTQEENQNSPSDPEDGVRLIAAAAAGDTQNSSFIAQPGQ